MNKPALNRLIFASPWIFTAAVAILLAVILVFAVDNMRREQKLMQDNLLQRGQGVVRLVEAGTRAAMMRMTGNELTALQNLLEQAGAEEGIFYIAIIDRRGLILAHSDPEQVGSILADPPPPPASSVGDAEELTASAAGNRTGVNGMIEAAGWRLLTTSAWAPRLFEVHAPFNPQAGRGRHWREMREEGQMPRHRMMGPMMHSAPAPNNQAATDLFNRAEPPLILVGLDMADEEAVIDRNRRHVFFISLALLLAGIGGLSALFVIQGYRRELERGRQHHEHLLALGKMAAGVAHEVRNPLSSIKGLATLLGERFPAGDSGHESARLLISQVERLNRCIGELLDYARPMPPARRPVDLNRLLSDALQLIAIDAQKLQVKVEFSPDPALPELQLDPDRITQVLLNLLLNALQAMPQGGELAVGTEKTTARGPCRIVIRDNGHGIEAADLERITDPYFTTKPDGSGLGLAMARKILDEHGARLEITSPGPGQGTTATIILPN